MYYTYEMTQEKEKSTFLAQLLPCLVIIIFLQLQETTRKKQNNLNSDYYPDTFHRSSLFSQLSITWTYFGALHSVFVLISFQQIRCENRYV